MRYIALNVAVAVVFLLLTLQLTRQRVSRAIWLTLAVLLALTLVFDPLIISAKIVAYNPQHILGWRLFGAPIEDFFYAVVAAIVAPLLWNWYEQKER